MPSRQIKSYSLRLIKHGRRKGNETPNSHIAQFKFIPFILATQLKNTVSFSILMSMNHDNDELNCVKTVNNGEKRKSNIKMHRALVFLLSLRRKMIVYPFTKYN